MKKEDKFTTYQQVCELEGVDPVQSLPFPDPQTAEQIALNGVAQTWRILRVFNKGIKVDFDNKSQAKYSVWWYMRSEADGGPGFSYCVSYYVFSYSFVGARLVFLDYDVMKWVTSQPEYVEIFKSWMTIPE